MFDVAFHPNTSQVNKHIALAVEMIGSEIKIFPSMKSKEIYFIEILFFAILVGDSHAWRKTVLLFGQGLALNSEKFITTGKTKKGKN